MTAWYVLSCFLAAWTAYGLDTAIRALISGEMG